jgi:Sigma-70, region 4
LPEDPGKLRRQIFKRLYTHLEHFKSQVEAGNFPLPLVVTIPKTGEDVYIDDLMVGIDSLPPRQREAFELIALKGWTETDAARKMMPWSEWSTPVQQYCDSALDRMIAKYDEKQAGTFVYTKYEPKVRKSSPRGPVRTPDG